jgi:hypothetical protein
VADAARSITLAGNLNLAGNFSTSGANALTLTTAGATNVTLPTTGTLVNNARAIATSGGLSGGGDLSADRTLVSSRTRNAQTGTSYTVLDGDRGKLVTFSNAGSIAVTLPQAGAASSFANGWEADFVNRGAGTVTITPTTSTINETTALALTTGQGVRIFSDGTNYVSNGGAAVGAGTGSVTSVTCGAGLTGGTFTNSGTCAINFAQTPTWTATHTWLSSSASFNPIWLESTDAGAATGPIIDLQRNSASPAASDAIGQMKFSGKDSAGNYQEYGSIYGLISSPTSTTESGGFGFQTVQAGTLAQRIVIGAGLYTNNATSGDMGADTINAGGYYKNGALILPASSTDNAAVRFDGTAGNTQSSALIIADTTAALSRSGNGGVPVQGTNTNDDAAAGTVGEVAGVNVLSGSAVALVTATAKDVNTGGLSLTAGDWDVSGQICFDVTTTTNWTVLGGGINTSSNTLPTPGGANRFSRFQDTKAAGTISAVARCYTLSASRMSFASTSSVFLVATATFSASTVNAYGYLYARRMR